MRSHLPPGSSGIQLKEIKRTLRRRPSPRRRWSEERPAGQEMQNILVTGGAGYIGSHTCKALFSSGLRPITFDSLSHGKSMGGEMGAFEEGDISDKRTAPRSRPPERAPVAAMHFAGSAVCRRVRDVILRNTTRNNVAGTITLLEVAAYRRPEKNSILEQLRHLWDPRSAPDPRGLTPSPRSILMVDRNS